MERTKHNDSEDRYVQFPLCLLQKIFEDPKKVFNLILDFGIVNYAKKFTYNLEEVARQLMYGYFRESELQMDLKYSLKKYIESGSVTYDPDTEGFDNNTFDPADSIMGLMELFESDRKFKRDAILYYQIKQAESFLNIEDFSIDGTIENYMTAYKYKSDFEQKYNPDSMPNVKPSMIFDFRDSGKDLQLFRAYIAIKSLIGFNRYIATTRNVILMRMFGCKSNQALNDFLKTNKEAKEEYEQINRTEKSLRYYFDKLFNNLLSKGFIKSKIFERKVSRKIFLSVSLDYDNLANEIIKFSDKRNHKKNELNAKNKIRATI